jgi:hypothetical protein
MFRASRQWSTRPADERFWSVADLAQSLSGLRHSERELPISALGVIPHGDDIKITGPAGIPVNLTNWSFGQLCRLIGAPADYLAGLPSDLACDCLRIGMSSRSKDNAKLLFQRNGEQTTLRAITSEGYSRIWDGDMCRAIQPALDAGWVTPPARPSFDDPRSRPATEADVVAGMSGGVQVQVGDLIGPSGVYRGDRDSFVFLMNPNRQIDNGGNDGGLFRGMIISNSEVGKASFRIQTFLFEGVCGNHIIWGASDISDLRLVHRGHANRRFGYELSAKLRTYTDAGTLADVAMINAAKTRVLGSDMQDVVDTLFAIRKLNVSRVHLEGSWAAACEWEHTAGVAPNTAWGFAHGMTRYSQTIGGFTDVRHALDVAAGKILTLAV